MYDDVLTVGWSRLWRVQLARDASLARVKESDCPFVDDSLSLADVVRNVSSERVRSVQSKSYDVMYSTTKPHRNDGTESNRYIYTVHACFSL